MTTAFLHRMLDIILSKLIGFQITINFESKTNTEHQRYKRRYVRCIPVHRNLSSKHIDTTKPVIHLKPTCDTVISQGYEAQYQGLPSAHLDVLSAVTLKRMYLAPSESKYGRRALEG